MKKEYVVGVTGASGACYARRLLEVLCRDANVHLIVSDIAQQIATHEGVSFEGINATVHHIDKMGASIASGSHRIDGMVVIPCSAKTLSAIATGYADNLITRTADVCLKEGAEMHSRHPGNPALQDSLEKHARCRRCRGHDYACLPCLLPPPKDYR